MATATETTYDQLETLCLPLLETYQTDLTKHDREWIEENPGVPFIHLTRCSGTMLIDLPPADSDDYPPKGEEIPYLFGTADRNHILRDKQIHMAAGDNETALIRMYYNGKIITRISAAKAALIVSDYINRVAAEWRKPLR